MSNNGVADNGQADDKVLQCNTSKKKKRVGLGFPFGSGSNRKELTAWLMRVERDFNRDDYLRENYKLVLPPIMVSDTPADMVRNAICRASVARGDDYIIMVDDDMEPDYLRDIEPDAKPFIKSSLQFMETVEGPSVVMAPYCGPPPDEDVYMFEWKWGENHATDFLGRIQMIPRAQAAVMRGFSQVPAGPTGLILIDCQVFRLLPPAWFYYEYEDVFRTRKASTEDVTFSRDCAMSRIPMFCNWDAWAVHWKSKKVPRPQLQTVDIVNERIRDIVIKGIQPHEFQIEAGANTPEWPDGIPEFTEDKARHDLLPIAGNSFRCETIVG